MSSTPSPHKKINGFHPPLSCPKDFSDQVRTIVWKYNQCIDDCDAYQTALLELQQSYRLLYKQHADLKEASERLAVKYEKLIEPDERPSSPTQPDVPESPKSSDEDE